ncbi:MAG: hypothetical protein ACRC24_08965 [Vibrionaceae bacterium]
MKKIIAALFAIAMSTSAVAGIVDGTMTKVRVSEQGNKYRFESRVPNLSFIVRKSEVAKGMLKVGKERGIAELEINGLIVDQDRKVGVTLDRRGDGLEIKSPKHTMFVTEKELRKGGVIK